MTIAIYPKLKVKRKTQGSSWLIVRDLDTNRSKSETLAEDTDTCTIQLVQDWLELEVLGEPVNHEIGSVSRVSLTGPPSLIAAMVTSIFIIIMVNLKARLRTTE